MRFLTFLFITFISCTVSAQQIDYNLKKGAIAEGYDVTEYFNNKVVEGKKAYTTTHDNAEYRFSNQENLEKFKANPAKFIPQYGGYCAYAMADNGKKIDINPKTFEIRDEKLYLFYNAWGTNTLDSWLKEGPEELQARADTAWLGVRYKH